MPAHPPQPTLGTVVPLAVEHLDQLYSWETEHDRFVDWRLKGLSTTPGDFASGSLAGPLMACGVVDHARQLVGSVTLDRYRRDEGTAELAVASAPASSGVLVAAAALCVLAGSFERGLTAVYLHTTEYNRTALRVLHRHALLEVRRPESEWHRARYWDSYIFRLDPARFDERLGRIAARASSMVTVEPACFTSLSSPGRGAKS